jgi:hypothetical protein
MCKYVSELCPTFGDSCPNIEIFTVAQKAQRLK